jgi:FtsP/CotA-like multicopper oxidase with cupredoxin domain
LACPASSLTGSSRWSDVKARIVTALSILAMLAGLAFLGFLGWMWWESRLPGSYDVMDYGVVDLGGGPDSAAASFSVANEKGETGRPDLRVTLTAEKAKVRLASGTEVDAWTFDKVVPGPELRVRQGDLVEVTVENQDIADGVTIHWHGLDVPNAEDGVAGVTQDAVLPGKRYTYRFRPEQVGTFWYHTHENASDGVRRGLYGALVILPREPLPQKLDLTLPVHTFSGRTAIGLNDGVSRRAVEPGTQVRLRLLNTNSSALKIRLAGMQASVVAIDGGAIEPAPLPDGEAIEVGAGGRYDVAFAMPSGVASAEVVGSKAALVLSPEGTGEPPEGVSRAVFDPASRAAAVPGGAAFDRTFRLEIGQKPGFLDGRPGRHWSLNGKLYPRVPMFMVSEGDLVRIELINHSGSVHPMHLHGHHFIVLTRNGGAIQRWSTDTLNLRPHERYEVAIRANNPGLWMLHCHNLPHARDGLTMHVMYDGVTTPFRAGDEAHNHPE